MLSDLMANAEVTVPKSSTAHLTANGDFIKRFNPSASRTDKMLLKNILSTEAIKPAPTTISTTSGVNYTSINADLLS